MISWVLVMIFHPFNELMCQAVVGKTPAAIDYLMESYHKDPT
jgi:hypothetical protein